MHSNEEHEVNVNTQSHHFTFTEDEEKDVSSALVDKKVLHMMQMMGYRSGFGLGKNEQGMTLPVEIEPQLGRRGFGLKIEKDEEKDVSSALVDKKVLHMMQMMGYRSGFGLGKNEQGMTLPVEIEPQLGRRGFGLKIESLQCSNEEWDFSLDNPTTVENVEWLQNNTNLRVTSDVMLTWSKEDVPKSNMKEEYNFCDKDILHNVIEGKNIFDRLDLKELCQARARANPFETIRVGLLYLIYKCFEKVCILKPNSSRPANSERYVICYNYKGREDVQNIRSYLTQLVGRLWEIRHNVNVDITEIVPLSIIKNDDNFYSYVVNSNNRIAKYQTINLQKLATFCRNPLLMDYRQDELRQSCLKYWQIPDMPKVPISRYSIENLLTETNCWCYILEKLKTWIN
ncbi:hypothetical protein MTP99_007706 [Tenebrio molitor]|nr:hypothetical protein MTP99_007706 [Tenebrio molitor]